MRGPNPAAPPSLTQDVRDESRWSEVVMEAKRRFGGLHVLVNNAGVMIAGTPETTTLERFLAWPTR